MRATLIIATRDRADFLRGCLASLGEQTAAGRFDVVVVDNGSSDATPAVAEQFGARRIFVADPNRGKARNAGLAAASGPLVLFCDDDTIAPPQFVAAHLRAHETRAARVVSGPIINVADAAARPAPGPHNYSRAFFCTCNASAPLAALRAAGGFDERYDLYGWEDTDLGIRLQARGLRRAWAWDAYIYHIKPKTGESLDLRISRAREKAQMAARFVRKSPTWPVKLATGAYPGNFARASLMNAAPLRRLYARLAAQNGWARDRLVDAAYVDALRTALKLGEVDPGRPGR